MDAAEASGEREPGMPAGLLVGRIQRFCLQDGPGIRTTVFTQGCPLCCWWCQNPDLQARGQPEARCWDCGALADEVERDARYWRNSGGGVTVSGGECMLQPMALAAFLTELGRRGHDRCVETAGAVPREHFAKVIPHVDRWLFDLKALDPARFKTGTGGDARVPEDNLRWLLETVAAPVTVRVPLVAGFNAGTDEPERIADLLTAMPRAVPVEILPGHVAGADPRQLRTDPRPAAGDLAAAGDALRRAGLEVTVRW